MGCSDGDGQGVATGTGSEIDNLLRTSVVGLLSGDLILNTGEDTKLSLDSHVVLVSIVNNLLCQSDILLVRKRGSVNHDRREAQVHAALAELVAVAVVQVKDDLRLLPAQFLGIFDGTLGHIAEQGLVRVVARTLGDLQDHRGLGLRGGLDNGLELLHVVEIECGDGVTTGDSLSEHLSGVHKAKIFVRNHNFV